MFFFAFMYSGNAKDNLKNSIQPEKQFKLNCIKKPFFIGCQVGFTICGQPVCETVYGDTWQDISLSIDFRRMLYRSCEIEFGCPDAYLIMA